VTPESDLFVVDWECCHDDIRLEALHEADGAITSDLACVHGGSLKAEFGRGAVDFNHVTMAWEFHTLVAIFRRLWSTKANTFLLGHSLHRHWYHESFSRKTRRRTWGKTSLFKRDHDVPKVLAVFGTHRVDWFVGVSLNAGWFIPDRKLTANNRRRKDLFSLPIADQQCLEELGYKKKLQDVDDAILANAKFLDQIVSNPDIFGHDIESLGEEGVGQSKGNSDNHGRDTQGSYAVSR
jgi:hypothetical protein